MASDTPKRPSLKEDLTCAICYDLFTDPVMLACMHHFCRACISTYWRSLRGAVSCPQCRQEFPTRQLQTNYLVAAMVEKVRASSSEGFRQNLQKQLKDSLESYRTKMEEYLNIIRQDEEKVETMKRVGAELQARVRGEFQALREVLQQEEAGLLESLRREEAELLQGAEHHLEQLRGAVLEAEQSMRVLQQAFDAMETSIEVELPEVNLRPAVQVEKETDADLNAFISRYTGPVQYIAWRKMLKLLKPAPVPLTFDPETAHPSLCLSRDKTVVVESQEMQPYRRNPKRFTQCVNVLAAQGFLSGRHYWEVGVAGSRKWDLGVALESVDRNARAKLSPENGYWTLRLREGRYWAGTQPWTPLDLDGTPCSIGVLLDCEGRRVCFYNADSMQLLYTFNSAPHGRVFPFFSPCVSERGHKPQPIRILHFPLDSL
ncbi:hypothetical protein AGOR_G00068220 [Albula goreensis]|uniref:Uncharacterized protein n=1 Tax=Albula goreensis TaxID=1534307 RepID=A0A8T3DKM4_9TELE|nr:hypothetical protein AGOR_G00068220 [Albula goreensis]